MRTTFCEFCGLNGACAVCDAFADEPPAAPVPVAGPPQLPPAPDRGAGAWGPDSDPTDPDGLLDTFAHRRYNGTEFTVTKRYAFAAGGVAVVVATVAGRFAGVPELVAAVEDGTAAARVVRKVYDARGRCVLAERTAYAPDGKGAGRDGA